MSKRRQLIGFFLFKFICFYDVAFSLWQQFFSNVCWLGKVGLCSYLLIGYWFENKDNASAGMKAFIVNKIRSLGFLIAIFLVYKNFSALSFVELQALVVNGVNPQLMGTITLICLCLCWSLWKVSTDSSLYLATRCNGWAYSCICFGSCFYYGYSRYLYNDAT